MVGLCAANRDAVRKAFPEQFRGFGHFLKDNPDALLLVHSISPNMYGLNLQEMAVDMGIGESVMFSETYPQVAGLMTAETMRNWYGCLDVLLAASYAEGFGIPILEAAACGVPSVVTGFTAATELSAGTHWAVRSEEFWNPTHHAWWRRPDSWSIAHTLAFARVRLSEESGDVVRKAVRANALDYDYHVIAESHWAPALAELGAQ